MKKNILSKYINEDDLAGLGGAPDPGMGGGAGKKLDQVPGDPKEKSIAVADAAAARRC